MLFRKQADILVDMIDGVSVETNRLTDFNVGSAARALFDAFSIEAENLYMLTVENISDGIESGLMSSFDFSPRDATYAYGDLKVTFNNDATTQIVIPAGATFSTGDTSSNLKFQTRDSYIVYPGTNTINITVYANTTGAAGNVEANQINSIESNIYNVATVTNPESFLTGSDAETYEQTKSRFQLFIESFGRATKNSLKYGALTVPEVHSVYVYEQVGLVTVYAADANGNLPSQVQRNVEQVLEDYRPAGIQLVVSPMVKTLVDVTVNVKFLNENLVTQQTLTSLEQVARNHLNSLDADADLVLSKLATELMNSDDNLADLEIVEPSANIDVANNAIIRAGSIIVQEMED
jgi:uncharacterized phage protein gp47/JayE